MIMWLALSAANRVEEVDSFVSIASGDTLAPWEAANIDPSAAVLTNITGGSSSNNNQEK